jgi:hypothetical protein
MELLGFHDAIILRSINANQTNWLIISGLANRARLTHRIEVVKDSHFTAMRTEIYSFALS